MIVVDRLTRVEREEIRRALSTYSAHLDRKMRSERAGIAFEDCKWRAHVVDELLDVIGRS